MSALEIVILIIAIILIFVSVIVKDDRTADDSPQVNLDAANRKKDDIIFEIDKHYSKIEDEVKRLVLDTQDSLDKESNEKIMSINEYSDTVLAKIDSNHKEVVFLYNTLKQEEEEMKETMSDMQNTRRENKELFDKLSKIQQEKKRAMLIKNEKRHNPSEKKIDGEQAWRNAVTKNSVARELGTLANKQQGDDSNENKIEPNPDNDNNIEDKSKDAEIVISAKDGIDKANYSEKKERVLKLYSEGKSINDISKILGMGQGEVRLMVELYSSRREVY